MLSTPHKLQQVDAEALHQFERAVMLQTMDNYWREHLAALDHLRQGIHLRGYAQKNPKQEYKREAFDLFSMMLDSVRNEVTRILMTVQIKSEQDVEAVEGTGGAQERSLPARWLRGSAGGSQRRGSNAQDPALRSSRREGGAQRSLPLRLGEEVQTVPRAAGLTRRAPSNAAATARNGRRPFQPLVQSLLPCPFISLLRPLSN